MGLDMYVYKIEKLDEQTALSLVGLHVNDIRDRFHYLYKDSFDEDPDMYSDLIPFVRQVSVVDTVFDHKSCFKAHGINEDDEVIGSFYEPDKAGWSFASGANVQISKEEYQSYLYDKNTEIYVFRSEQVAYWRKYYDLDEFFETARIVCRAKQFVEENGRPPQIDDVKFWKTENCGYYMLSVEEKQAIKSYLLENEKSDDGDYHPSWRRLLDDDESVLMYHAWW